MSIQDPDRFSSKDKHFDSELQTVKSQLSEKSTLLHQVQQNYEKLKEKMMQEIQEVKQERQIQENTLDAEVRKMKVCIERLEKQNKILEQEKKDYKAQYADLNQTIKNLSQELQSKKDELNQQVHQSQRHQHDTLIENKSLKEKIKLLEAENINNLQLALNEKNRLQQEIDKLHKYLEEERIHKESMNIELHELRSQITHHFQQEKIKSEEMQTLKNQMIRLKQELQEKTTMQAEIKIELQDQISFLEKERNQLSVNLQDLQKTYDVVFNEKEAYKAGLENLQADLSQTKTQALTYDKEIEDIKHQHELANNHLKNQIEELTKKNKVFQQTEILLNQEKSTLMEELTKLKEQYQDSRNKVHHFESAYETRLHRLELELKEKQSQEKKLKEQLEHSQQHILQAKAHHNEHSERAKELDAALMDIKREKEAYENQNVIELERKDEQIRLLKNELQIGQQEKEQIIAKLNETLRHVKSIETKNNDETTAQEAKINHLMQSVEQLEKQNKIFEKEKEEYQHDKVDLQKHLNQSLEQLKNYKSNIQAIQNKAEAEINKARIELEDATAKNKNIILALEQSNADRLILQEQLKKLKDGYKEKLNKMENDVKILEVKLQKSSYAYQKIEGDLKSITKENDKLRKERNELIKTLESYLIKRQKESGQSN